MKGMIALLAGLGHLAASGILLAGASPPAERARKYSGWVERAVERASGPVHLKRQAD
jgi:hypothetical protein